MASSTAPGVASGRTPEWAAGSSGRVLAFAGIALVIAGMLLGDVFAIFVLHQNAARIGDRLAAAATAVTAGDAQAAAAQIQQAGGLLENRGTKVDAHVHSIDFGYLALLLAILQPWVLLPERSKSRLAWLFVAGAAILPAGVFLIHYVGLAYSPLQNIGWASIVADAGGLVVAVAAAGELAGLVLYARSARSTGGPPVGHVAVGTAPNPLLETRSWCARVLLAGGALLVLAGFVYGAWYSAFDLYRIEQRESAVLSQVLDTASHAGDGQSALASYGDLQAEKAVKIAAHAHIIEFGLLAMVLALVQPLVFFSERWRRRWAVTLLAGSLLLPLFVLLELRWGLLAGGIADFGGLLVIVALTAMAAGVLRNDGALHAGQTAPQIATDVHGSDAGDRAAMSRSRVLLIVGGLALALWGISYGLWYAVAAEHQVLDRMGSELAGAFAQAASRDAAGSASSVQAYSASEFTYTRQVDVHSHWIGLAMLLVFFGLVFDNVNLRERARWWLASALLGGAILFPGGVLLQTMISGRLPSIIAVAGAGVVTLSLAIVVFGLVATGYRRLATG